jgi:SAM-dependent methyltransferase
MEVAELKLKSVDQKLSEIRDNTDPNYSIADSLKPGDEQYDLLSPFKVGYSQVREQQFMFYNTLYDYDPAKHSILDIGCSRGDLYGYLTELYPAEYVRYTGIDVNSEMAELAKQKYNFEIIQDDFLNVENINADFVIATGIFTSDKDHNNKPQNINTILKSIDKLYDIANFAVSFNLLTEITNHTHDGYLFINPSKIIDKLVKKYTYLNVYHNYSDSVYTITIFK